MGKGIEDRLVGMAGDQHQVFLGRAPFIHELVMEGLVFVVTGRGIGIDFQDGLQGSPDITDEPFAEGIAITLGIALVAMTGFGTTFGLLVGGLLSMRPDHGHVIAQVRQYLRQGRWAVVAHPDNPEQVASAESTLKDGSERVMRTL